MEKESLFSDYLECSRWLKPCDNLDIFLISCFVLSASQIKQGDYLVCGFSFRFVCAHPVLKWICPISFLTRFYLFLIEAVCLWNCTAEAALCSFESRRNSHFLMPSIICYMIISETKVHCAKIHFSEKASLWTPPPPHTHTFYISVKPSQIRIHSGKTVLTHMFYSRFTCMVTLLIPIIFKWSPTLSFLLTVLFFSWSLENTIKMTLTYESLWEMTESRST